MSKRKKKLLQSYDDRCLVYGKAFQKNNREALKKLQKTMDPRAFKLACFLAEQEIERHQAELREALEEEGMVDKGT